MLLIGRTKAMLMIQVPSHLCEMQGVEKKKVGAGRN